MIVCRDWAVYSDNMCIVKQGYLQALFDKRCYYVILVVTEHLHCLRTSKSVELQIMSNSVICNIIILYITNRCTANVCELDVV